MMDFARVSKACRAIGAADGSFPALSHDAAHLMGLEDGVSRPRCRAATSITREPLARLRPI